MFNENLNPLLVYDCLNNEVEKLSGKFLQDTAFCLADVLKHWYFLKMHLVGAKQPFEALQNFMVSEIKMVIPDCVQGFFELDENESSNESLPGAQDLTVLAEVVGKGGRAGDQDFTRSRSLLLPLEPISELVELLKPWM